VSSRCSSSCYGEPATPLVPDAGARPPTISAIGALPMKDSADSYHVAALLTDGSGYTVLVALPTDDVQDATDQLAAVLLAGAPILFALLVGLSWLVVGRALAPMTALHRRQEEFVSDAAHELRTPLAALHARLELLESDTTAEGEVRTELPRLRAEVARMSALVDGLLALVRSGDGRLQGVDVDLDDVVRNAVRRLRERTTHTVDVPTMDAVRVSGDTSALSRLVDNLLDNAARHARSAITVTVAADRGEGVVTVADDGPGIAAEDRERIFGRFTRMDSARARDEGGAGLGLAIVRAVARAHGGDVTVIDDGPGAHFEVRLPAVR
jgi:signal transduction histidine kinase